VDPDEEFMNSSGGRARSGAYDEVVRTVFWVLLLMIAVLASASFLRLRSPDSATAAPTKTPIAGAPVGTVREIMKTLVDPNAEIVWGAVGVIHEKSGTVEKEPRTEDEWTTVENGAMTLAEVATLLKTPGRHIARPEEAGTSRWPQATLTPVQIEQEVGRNRVVWDKAADALQAAAAKAFAAARAHDKEGVFNIGEEIDNACESCHIVYWYPVNKN
jgi:hypothetical protein